MTGSLPGLVPRQLGRQARTLVALVGEDLGWRRPASAVHGGLVARAVRHEIGWVGARRRGRANGQPGGDRQRDQQLSHPFEDTRGILTWWSVTNGSD